MSKELDRVAGALRDCVAVMERDLKGLYVIQPELAQAKKALDELDIVDADFVEWDGEGLPPVGVECEHQGTADSMDWMAVKIIAHTMAHGRDVAVFQYGDTVSFSSAQYFRPIRTPEQIAAEEREKAVQEMLRVIGGSSRRVAEQLHDAGWRKHDAQQLHDQRLHRIAEIDIALNALLDANMTVRTNAQFRELQEERDEILSHYRSAKA